MLLIWPEKVAMFRAIDSKMVGLCQEADSSTTLTCKSCFW